MSGRSAMAFRLALAGGQEEQPWLWNSSTTVGLSRSAACAGVKVSSEAASARLAEGVRRGM
jgi:hypothetical protein